MKYNDRMKKIHTWFNQRIFLFVVIALTGGYFLPLEPTPAMKYLVIVLFSYMTFSTALAYSFRGFLKISRNPGMPLYTLCIVHIGIPVVAWIVGLIFFPDNPLVRIGFLISSAVPVGITSLIWTHIGKGNVPLSLVIVSIDTILAPVLLPLFILFVVGAVVSIDYFKMILDLLFMITLPSIVGMLLYDFSGGKTKSFAEGAGGIMSRLAMFWIIFLNAGFVAPFIVWSPLILKILLVTCLLVALGYFIGYLAGNAVRTDRATILAIIYSTGMRNIVTGLVIATSYFPHETAMPIALAMLFQQPFAALTVKIFNWMFPSESLLDK
jgi:predicted Na+-dependent transporter